jgi:hypothetical protein
MIGRDEDGLIGGDCVVSGVAGTEVLTVDDDGAERELGSTRLGIEGGGSSSSVYISSKMLERPTIAEGWSAK